MTWLIFTFCVLSSLTSSLLMMKLGKEVFHHFTQGEDKRAWRCMGLGVIVGLSIFITGFSAKGLL